MMFDGKTGFDTDYETLEVDELIGPRPFRRDSNCDGD
jgi:hypothetical protein